MTKQYEGNIWTEVDSRGVVKIGFSRDYIDQQLMECFHVVQADRSVARKGQPIMVLETNDGTARIKSPINGRILTFNGKARDFPDRLSEEDVIMEVLPEGVKLEPKKKVEYKDVFNQVIDWNAVVPQPGEPVNVVDVDDLLGDATEAGRLRAMVQARVQRDARRALAGAPPAQQQPNPQARVRRRAR